MKFKVNVGQFVKSLKPVVDIATKSVTKDWELSNMMTIKASQDGITGIAHGGSASIVVPISDKNCSNLNYSCIEEGSSTVSAITFMNQVIALNQAEDIIVTGNQNNFVMALESDSDISETIPVFGTEVKPHPIAKKFEKTVKVNREAFITGIGKVQFAIGDEITKPYYKCLLFETVSNTKIRFAAGSGARFAVDEIEGKNIIELDNGELVSFIFPDTNIPNISRILDYASGADIVVKQAKASDDNQDQIVIEYDGNTLILQGIDTSIKFAEVHKVLDFNYSNKVTSDISQWALSANGIDGTLKAEKSNKQYRNTDVTADLKNMVFFVVAETTVKTKSKPKISGIIAKGDENDPSFRCSSKFVIEIVRNATISAGDVEIHFEDKNRPVVFRYPRIVNSTKDTTEDFSIFFATLKKND